MCIGGGPGLRDRSVRGHIDDAHACGTAEQTQSLLADKRRTEYREEQIKARENFAEEERSETYEQTREATESWREYHYDGLYPSYRLNRHIPY